MTTSGHCHYKANFGQNQCIAAWSNKRGPFFENVSTFVSKEVSNPQGFFRTFLASLHQARLMLMKESCMSYDFQALLDVYAYWYYIDFVINVYNQVQRRKRV